MSAAPKRNPDNASVILREALRGRRRGNRSSDVNLDDSHADVRFEGSDDELTELADLLLESHAPASVSPESPPGTTAVQEATAVQSETGLPKLVEKFLGQRSIALARKLGYGLLVMGIIDFIFIFIPPQFLNPVWEYQVIGDVVKLVPLPILAFLLIFVGERNNRSPIERRLLKALAWLTLLISVFFFLLLPLIVTDYVRIDRFNNAQISEETNLQKRKLNATQDQLSKMDPEQIQDLIPARDQMGSLGTIPNSPAEAKKSIVDNIERAKAQADERAATARQNVTLNLRKNSTKLFMQALLSAVLYLLLWRSTDWARRTQSRRKSRGGWIKRDAR
ncbi:HpsJ-like protein, cyanoexosortase A-associated [Lyngbya confervoides]|uniref:HpsJ family protein n=1 Tax=Lyngbya confervoides BDU141951 TaxID=1574623 RepID=A0ABD4SZ76_9CYAN|nr:HpsJ family protein [Lyngbya confervoides]MCM1981604.1 HpsJ family protein [Lyngbya confervoides BDU141951]